MRLAVAIFLVITLFTLLSPVFFLPAREGKEAIVAQAPDAGLVVPGERVGQMKLGMRFEQVTKSLGNDYRPAGPNPSSTDVVFPNYHLTFSLSGDRETVRGIGVMSSDYHTEAGIHVGSPESAVLSAYGNADSSDSLQKGGCRLLRYNSRGITFVLSREGSVVSFCIFSPQ